MSLATFEKLAIFVSNVLISVYDPVTVSTAAILTAIEVNPSIVFKSPASAEVFVITIVYALGVP